MVWLGPVDIDPDPRISSVPPGWLSGRADWADLLGAMSREDVGWLDAQWRLAAERATRRSPYSNRAA